MNGVLNWLSENWEAVFGGAGVAALTFLRAQLKELWIWFKSQYVSKLPWNRKDADILKIERMMIVVSIDDIMGKSASFSKTTEYIALKDLSELREGIAVSGTADNFKASMGHILGSERSRGFYSSQIDIGNIVKTGKRFTNVYTATLKDTFTDAEENWGQDIAYETNELLLKVEFPRDRQPKLLKCRVSSGIREEQVETQLNRTLTSQGSCVEWLVSQPKKNHCYAIVWVW